MKYFKNKSSHIDLIIPGLLWLDQGDIDGIYKELKTPNLLNLIRRTRPKVLNFNYSDIMYNLAFPDVHGSLARYLSREVSANNVNSPTDSVNLVSDYRQDGHKGQHRHLITALVEPTHLRVDRDRLLITESEVVQIDDNEANQIIAYLNLHTDDYITISKINVDLWLMEIEFKPESKCRFKPELNSTEKSSDKVNYTDLELRTPPVLDIIGENIDDYLSLNHIKINSILNEIQMILFDMPVNQERKKRGELSINSIWLWDKTLIHNIEEQFNPNLFSNNQWLRQYNKHVKKLDNSFSLHNEVKSVSQSIVDKTLIIDYLYSPLCYRDSYSWITRFEELDQTLFKLLLQNLANKNLKKINIFIPTRENTIQLQVSKLNAWKIWHSTDLTTLALAAH